MCLIPGCRTGGSWLTTALFVATPTPLRILHACHGIADEARFRRDPDRRTRRDVCDVVGHELVAMPMQGK
jgi:hypothetical protein